jgi:tRNA threonylcarbamoyladenosine biosynthesis protein TsaE
MSSEQSKKQVVTKVPLAEVEHALADEEATVRAGNSFGSALAALGCKSLVCFLEGDLGAGKTTFTRGVLQSLGHKAAVKSPTYTLVEPYEHCSPPAFHFDLYRLAEAEELEYMGFRDYLDLGICLLEWPSRGAGILPAPDIVVSMVVDGKARKITLQGFSEIGGSVVKATIAVANRS